ncbi:MAG: MerR family transcriptional regulator, partial [Spirochaetales bacterium]|nr:MerR family transcriptional regulator [Spirochaetales bacterium]
MEYRIGDFAVITRLSVKTLRYYHEEGLLEPTRVAFNTGYRYYDGELIYIARIIDTLRQWGFSIREIREILNEYSDDSDLVEVVQRKKTEISEKIIKLKKIEEELSLLIQFEREYEDMKENTKITVKELEEIKIISITYKGKYSECGKYMGKLFKIGGSKIAGKVFNQYLDEGYEEIANVEVCLPVKEEITNSDVEYKVLPACKVISTINIGPYDEVGRAY